MTVFFAMEPQYQWWTPWETGEICSWTYAEYFMHGNCYVSHNLYSKCLPYPHQQLGKKKSLCQMDFTCAAQWWKSHACSSGHHPSASLEKWRHCIFLSHYNAWMSHAHSYWSVSWNDRMLNGTWQCYQGRSLHSAVRVLWKSCTLCSSVKTDFCWTIPCHCVLWSLAYITADFCR